MAKSRFVIAEQADFRLCYSRFESKSEQFFCGKVFLGREMSGAANDVNSFLRKKKHKTLFAEHFRPICASILLSSHFIWRGCREDFKSCWSATVVWRLCFNDHSRVILQVALHFLPATSIRCMLEPWLREVGFIICYGAIVLKLYRHLVEFRTRKAHRYVVRDLDLLRYLCAMIVAVLCYLAAFTALCIDYLDYSALIWRVEMESVNIVTSNMCKPLKWDYVSLTLFFCR